jgi:CRP/FNR family cyclic AMP-dependent transcriptional regulator
VLEPTRLAVLDAAFVQALSPWPRLVPNLLRRQERHADRLAHVLVISHLPRVELRVHVLFWLFADRRGRRRGNGVTVLIPLTHLSVARLTGARRRRLANTRGAWLLAPSHRRNPGASRHTD